MGWLNKIKSMINTENEYEKDDVFPGPLTDDDDDDIVPAITPEKEEPTGGFNVSGTDSDAALELKVVRPETYASVTEIADHLLAHRTVVLNLEATNKEVAKRLIDFLAGVAYSIDGQLKNVANNTYIITPCNVDVAESKVKAAEMTRQAVAQPTAPTVNLTSDTLF
jgi:cell division inhibitor SepF